MTLTSPRSLEVQRNRRLNIVQHNACSDEYEHSAIFVKSLCGLYEDDTRRSGIWRSIGPRMPMRMRCSTRKGPTMEILQSFCPVMTAPPWPARALRTALLSARGIDKLCPLSRLFYEEVPCINGTRVVETIESFDPLPRTTLPALIPLP
jgi:hypothetical protein